MAKVTVKAIVRKTNKSRRYCRFRRGNRQHDRRVVERRRVDKGRWEEARGSIGDEER